MSWTLDGGAHGRPEDGVCLMEAVAWVAGEPHSDRPVCACPVLSAYGRRLNDVLGREDRQRLAVFVPRLVGSKASAGVERRRMFRLADVAVRVFAASAMDAVGLGEEAVVLRALAPIVDEQTASDGAAGAARVAGAAEAAWAAEAAGAAWAAGAAEAAWAARAAGAAEAAGAAWAARAAWAAGAAWAAWAAWAAGAARAAEAARIVDVAIAVFDELLPEATVRFEREPEECPAWA